jgi:hypothetical protein
MIAATDEQNHQRYTKYLNGCQYYSIDETIYVRLVNVLEAGCIGLTAEKGTGIAQQQRFTPRSGTSALGRRRRHTARKHREHAWQSVFSC